MAVPLLIAANSMSRFSSTIFLAFWYATSDLRPALSTTSCVPVTPKVFSPICVRLPTRLVGVTAATAAWLPCSTLLLTAAARPSVCHSGKVLAALPLPMDDTNGVSSGAML